jgi:ubiquitin C-terminal hydrolase|tara:strand:- start:65 stop:1102 length:1038 start_codon:yes stop_codon:yes gene_type:complete
MSSNEIITGTSGLLNLGNTCFMNSIIQVLSHTYEFQKEIIDSVHRLDKKRLSCTLVCLWLKLREELWAKDRHIVKPELFVRLIQFIAKQKQNSMFTGWDQNDASEFFVFLMEILHEGLVYPVSISINGKIHNQKDKIARLCYTRFKEMNEKEYSKVVGMFYGIQVTQMTSITDENLSNTADPYFIIHLPIPNHKTPTITDCFDAYIQKELLENDSAWYNEETKQKQSAFKHTCFWSFPDVLVVDFKRFHYDGRKNNILIDFPLDMLDLNPYSIGYTQTNYYECYGIVNHSGKTMGGHYTSFVKHLNGKWYHYNDSYVSEMSTERLITPKAYMLFYRRISRTILKK